MARSVLSAWSSSDTARCVFAAVFQTFAGALLPSAIVFAMSAIAVSSVFAASPEAIRFMPIGDSYTIGEGVAETERWPNQTVKLLAEKGIALDLIDNPGRTGWTTAEAVAREVPLLSAKRVELVTVLIGVNDWVQGATVSEFRDSLKSLLDKVQSALPDKRRVLLITIPDFGVTPTGAIFSRGRNISAGIAEFNGVIAEEAAARGLPLADVFQISKLAAKSKELLATDGLHPSGLQYSAWTGQIAPKLEQLITKTSDKNAP